MTIPRTQRNKIKKLYIIEGKKLDEISEIIGVNVRTIENWAVKEGWKAQQLEYCQIQDRIELNLYNLYEVLSRKASESLDPQDTEAVFKLNKILEREKGGK